MSNWKIEDSKNKLRSVIDSQLGYHSYQLARYSNDVTIDLNFFEEWNDAVWNYRYYNVQDPDLAQSPKINVVKSVIDSLVSKISNQKVRPYFNPVNGLYSTRAIVKQAQQFFDIIYDKEKVHDKVTQAFRNACIFGIGYVFFNPFTKSIEVPGSWQIGILNTEQGYGKPTKCLIEYKCFPVTLLDKYGIKGKYQSNYVNFKLFFDTIEGKAIAYINEVKALEKSYKADVIPLIAVNCNKPVFGTRSTSIVDELDGIQTNIDLICNKMSAAMQLTPANTTYVEAGSSLQPGDLSSKTGNVYTVKMGPGVNNLPVVNVTPAPFDPMLQNLLDSLIKQAYEIAGISQLSAQSKKPAGLDSGVALQTLEDIESDRFQTQVDHYVHAFIDLADLIIELMDDDTILPKSVNTAEYTWEDIRKQKELFKIQFSATSALSKDPQTKLQQVMQLTQVGLITTDKIAMYLDSPDLEDAYKGASAIQDAIDATIQRAIDNEVYDIPDYISYQQLLTQIIIEENKLYASEDMESLNKLHTLKDNLLNIMNEEGFVDLSNEPSSDTVTEQGLGAGAPMDITGAAAQAQAFAQPSVEDQFATPQENGDMYVGEEGVGQI